jgi:hypothetical protein
VQRSCDGCGKAYEATRPTSKYCGSSCRSRASVAKVSSLQPLAAPESSEGPLAASVVRELRAAGRLETPAGQHALILARRVESSHETGAAVASLSKALTDVMARALDGVKVAADPLDELRARRSAKSAG